MKKYIVSFLIPLLLLHFTGCYSYSSIQYSELKNLENDENIRITTKKRKVFVIDEKMDPGYAEFKSRNNPDCVYCTGWLIEQEKLTLKCFNSDSTASQIIGAAKMDSSIYYYLTFSEIGLMEVENFPWAPLIALALAGATIVLLSIFIFSKGFMSGMGGKWGSF